MGSAWISNGLRYELGSAPSGLQQSSVNAGNSPIKADMFSQYTLQIQAKFYWNPRLSFWRTFILSPEYEYWLHSTACSGEPIPGCLNWV